jgi:hypothetical protein
MVGSTTAVISQCRTLGATPLTTLSIRSYAGGRYEVRLARDATDPGATASPTLKGRLIRDPGVASRPR